MIGAIQRVLVAPETPGELDELLVDPARVVTLIQLPRRLLPGRGRVVTLTGACRRFLQDMAHPSEHRLQLACWPGNGAEVSPQRRTDFYHQLR